MLRAAHEDWPCRPFPKQTEVAQARRCLSLQFRADALAQTWCRREASPGLALDKVDGSAQLCSLCPGRPVAVSVLQHAEARPSCGADCWRELLGFVGSSVCKAYRAAQQEAGTEALAPGVQIPHARGKSVHHIIFPTIFHLFCLQSMSARLLRFKSVFMAELLVCGVCALLYS